MQWTVKGVTDASASKNHKIRNMDLPAEAYKIIKHIPGVDVRHSTGPLFFLTTVCCHLLLARLSYVARSSDGQHARREGKKNDSCEIN